MPERGLLTKPPGAGYMPVLTPEPREDSSESSKPFQQPGGGRPVGTHRAHGGSCETRSETHTADDGTAISARGEDRQRKARWCRIHRSGRALLFAISRTVGSVCAVDFHQRFEFVRQ